MMEAHAVPITATDAVVAVIPRVIEAVDLTGSPESRRLWRRRRGVAPAAAAAGRPSPMGFLLTERREPGGLASPWQVRLFVPGTEPAAPDALRSEPGTRPAQTVRIKGAAASEGDLVLTIGPEGAQVVAPVATWNALAEPVMLAVCQYWRFRALDEQLDQLAERAEGDVGHAAMSVPRSLWQRRRLLHNAREVRTLLLDLPHFQEPLTDPYPFCTSERSVQTYRSLAEKLHLEEWAEAIDDRVEAVEDNYASVTEKLCEYRNFAWGATLEILIIVILLAELGMQIVNYLSE
jgi:hypothetical protein